MLKDKIAYVKYYPGHFEVIEYGSHVICAVTGRRIAIDDLAYWNVEKQEAYIDAKTAFNSAKERYHRRRA